MFDDSLLPPPYRHHRHADERARALLEHFRWSNGLVRCPQCNAKSPIYKQTRNAVAGYYRCQGLHHRPDGSMKPLVFTVRTGTLLERSHLPLGKWIHCLAWNAARPSSGVLPLASTFSKRLQVNRKTGASLLKILHHLRFGDTHTNEQDAFLFPLMVHLLHDRKGPASRGRR